ncbi:vacuolar amino acid transporter 1-like [Tripterygium wilfordii]|uniref:Vacuolar amino acid transporter 1-like n=1 Tax=Tripterygium wilfordii TaxID=458696 RepID=A0A7J7DMX0_TRIWF|nr:amino acid transporter AVT1D-like [Tripterygium wilfordii]KAF5747564.1 vacuolar amino acid transporter 1-like [Tripterygium wilfordii]
MKLEVEDLGHDRRDEFQTDDEENQAERVCDSQSDTDTDSDVSETSRVRTSTWPQSYKESLDRLTSVTPPSFSFLRGTNSTGISTSFTSPIKRRQSDELDSPLGKPLISGTAIDREEEPYSTLPTNLSISTHTKSSISDLPPLSEQCSFSQALLNGINVLCGIGLLTTPYAVKEGGWLSLLLLLLFAIICCNTGILLQRCLQSSPGLRTYPDIGQAAFGASGGLAISIMLYVELYASCVEFVIMMADNLSTLFPDTSLTLAGIHLDSLQIFAITATLLVLPTAWLRDLSILSYLSVGGVATSILVVLCLLWVGVVDKVGFHPSGTALDVVNLPVSLGIYGFGFSGHSVFPNIYTSMKEPSQFPSVIISSFAFCFFMYSGVAIFGFLMFGDSIKSQYTLNLPTQFVASKIAVWTAVVNPMTKYALTITPIALSLEELMPSHRLRSCGVRIIIRTILVISTLIVGLTVPFFGIVMALIGSLLAMIVAVIFPCVCYLKLLKGKLTKFQIVTCYSTILLGFVSGCLGTYSAVKKLADKFI